MFRRQCYTAYRTSLSMSNRIGPVEQTSFFSRRSICSHCFLSLVAAHHAAKKLLAIVRFELETHPAMAMRLTDVGRQQKAPDGGRLE